MKRPIGFTILSLLLGWFALAGFVNGIIQFNRPQSIVISFLAFCYGLTALMSAIGLWKFRPWAFKAVASWVVIVVILALIMQFGMYGIYSSTLPLFTVFILFLGALLGALLFYIKRTLEKVP